MAESLNRDALLAFDTDFTTLIGILADDSRDAEIRRTLERFRNHPNRLGVALNSLLGLTRDGEDVAASASRASRNGGTAAARDIVNENLPGSSGQPRLAIKNGQARETIARRDELLDPKKFLPNDFLAKFPDPVAYFNDTTRPVDSLYKQHALVQLLNEFPAFSEDSLRQYLAVNNHHYYPTKNQIKPRVQPQVQQPQNPIFGPICAEIDKVVSACIDVTNAVAGVSCHLQGQASSPVARASRHVTKKLKASAGPASDEASTFPVIPRSVVMPWPQEPCEAFFCELQFATHEERILKRIRDLQVLRQLKVAMAREDGLSWPCGACGDECLPEEASVTAKSFCPTCVQTFAHKIDFTTAKELASVIRTALGAQTAIRAGVEDFSVSYHVQGLGEQWECLDSAVAITLERFYHAPGKMAKISDLNFDFATGVVSLRNRSYAIKRQTDSIPVSWISSRSQVTHAMVDLSPSSFEFKRVLKAINAEFSGKQQVMSFVFSGAYLSANFLPHQLGKIQRIENVTLHSLYQIQKAKIEKNCPKDCQVERMLFHGTASQNVDGICENGFNRSRVGQATANPGFYGAGTYFSPSFDYSRQFARDGKLLYCNVLVGESIVGHWGMAMPPNKPHLPDVPYESAVNSLVDPTEIVIFADCNVYPAYLVTV